jgi:glucose-1-phosphate cytidylyltransferase
VHDGLRHDWTVHLVDTGLATMTGGRLLRLKPWLGDDCFMMTYGDGLADVDIRALVAFHHSHGRLATVTAAHPPARFGDIQLEGNQVIRFAEKPQAAAGWINAGFFVLHPKVLDYIKGDDTIWERDPLEQLARDGQLMAYCHKGFWQPMDTLREKQILEEIWQSGRAPWKTL